MSWGAIGGAAIGAAGSYLSSKKNAKAAQAGATEKLDPRMDQILYGGSGGGGLLQQLAGLANTQRPAGQQNFGTGINSYLNDWGLDSFMRNQQAAQSLQETQNAAPQVANTQGVNVSTVKAPALNTPSQGTLDLKSAFQNTIYGDAGANPYLTKSLQGAADMSRMNFNQLQQDATRNLRENILPGIRGGAIAAGQYGGSRQGIAEGRALGDSARASQQAATQFGLGTSNAAIGAQADAFNRGQDRSLAALLNLSGQQFDQSRFGAQQALQAQLANQNAFQNAETTNAGLRQGVNLANINSQLQTNNQNAQNRATGIGLSSGLLGQAVNFGNQSANADVSRLGAITGALAPFTGLNQTQTQPAYQNTAGNVIGGALGGLSLFNQFKGMGGGGSGGLPSIGSATQYNWGQY
jgi:hypothetical protein